MVLITWGAGVMQPTAPDSKPIWVGRGNTPHWPRSFYMLHASPTQGSPQFSFLLPSSAFSSSSLVAKSDHCTHPGGWELSIPRPCPLESIGLTRSPNGGL